MRLLLTGGCGFIGSAVVRHVIRTTGHSIVNVDKMTYAASEEALEEAAADPRHTLIRADIADARRHARRVRTLRARCGDAPGGGKPRRSFDRRARPVRADQRRRHLHAAGGGARLLGRAAARRGAGRSASTTSPPTRCSAPSAPAMRRSPRRRPTIRAAPIPPARPPPTISCAPGTTPTACPRSSATRQQLRALAVSGEADPAGHAQRARRQDAAGLWRRLQRARLDLRRGSRRRAAAGAGARRARCDLRHRGAPAAQQSRRGASDLRRARRAPAGCGRAALAADQLRHRPAGARFPLRDRPRAQRGGARLARAA